MTTAAHQREDATSGQLSSGPPRPMPERPGSDAGAVARRALSIRTHIIHTVANVGEGYLLQGLGAADILAALYFSELRLDPDRPDHPDRDRCLLCTAHNSVGLYSALAERGFFPAAELDNYGRDGSKLEIISSEHVPGVEGTFGSLGQGLSVAVGLALSSRRRHSKWRVYAVLGDGEMQEGQTWEAAMAAAAYQLDNLCLIIDLNGMQVEGATSDVLPMGPIAAKWQAFGWSVQEINGQVMPALLERSGCRAEHRGHAIGDRGPYHAWLPGLLPAGPASALREADRWPGGGSAR